MEEYSNSSEIFRENPLDDLPAGRLETALDMLRMAKQMMDVQDVRHFLLYDLNPITCQAVADLNAAGIVEYEAAGKAFRIYLPRHRANRGGN